MNREQLELPVPFTNNTYVTTHAKYRMQLHETCNEYKNYTVQELHAYLHGCISPH